MNQLEDKSPELLYNLALGLLNAKHNEEAASAWEKALSLKPDLAEK